MIPIRNEKCGLGEIILSGDCQKHLIGQPLIKRHDSRRIPGENLIGKGVDLI